MMPRMARASLGLQSLLGAFLRSACTFAYGHRPSGSWRSKAHRWAELTGPSGAGGLCGSAFGAGEVRSTQAPRCSRLGVGEALHLRRRHGGDLQPAGAEPTGPTDFASGRRSSSAWADPWAPAAWRATTAASTSMVRRVLARRTPCGRPQAISKGY